MKLLRNEPLKKHTSFRIGGRAKLLAVPENIDQLQSLLKNNELPLIIIGGGTNILAADNGFKGLVIKTSKLNKVYVKGNLIVAQAGAGISKIVNKALKNKLTGLEFLAGIPGSVGGAVKGNAGAWRKSVGISIEFVKTFTRKGASRKITKKKLRFFYRKSNIKGIIYEVAFKLKKGQPSRIKKTVMKYLKRRNEKHPSEPSAGSTFINPVAAGKNSFTAGRLIESVGLKGLRVGGAEVSKKHANFIINTGSATAKDVINLIKIIKNRVKTRLNVTLQPEIHVIE